MLKPAVVFACLLLSLSSGARAQWYVGLQLATANYRGSAIDTSGNPHAGPGGGTALGLRLERSAGQARVGLKLSYGKPGLSITGQGLTVTDKTAGQLIESAAVVSFRVGGIGPSGAARVELGPALHLWKAGDEIRARVGALTAAAYEWPVAGKLSGAVRLEGIISKSWFDKNDLPPEFRRQVTWRYGVSLGLLWRL
jgi:hypothetical protein